MAEETASYNQIIIEHLKHPRNMGEMEDPDGVGEAQNPVCGDTMRLFIKVEMDRIVNATFLTFGCGAAIASSSITTEMVKGKTLDEVLDISNQAVADALGGLPPTKLHCSVLAQDAVSAAVSDFSEEERGREMIGREISLNLLKNMNMQNKNIRLGLVIV
jgi:nitrogen fixation NifU-like protein